MAKERIYLAVDYESRQEAKELGAKWDRARKLWYADANTAVQALQKWISNGLEKPENRNPRTEFSEALAKMGFIVGGEHPVMDGERHRLSTLGDNPGSTSGFYVGFMNTGQPGGYAKNHRTGEEIRWSAKNHVKFTKEQRELFNSQVKKQREITRNEELLLQEKTAKSVNYLIESEFSPITEYTPYHIKKNIPLTAGTYTDHTKLIIAVPHLDITGKIWAMTYILENGKKRYSKNGKKTGCFHVVGGFSKLEDAPAIVIAEGYSTAATLFKYLGYSIVAAFDNGNLLPVARILRDKYPDKKIIIAGDDDRHIELIQNYNPGREKAIEAASAVSGVAVFPSFSGNPPTGEVKSRSDWNDLANDSHTGLDDFTRQLRSAFPFIN